MRWAGQPPGFLGPGKQVLPSQHLSRCHGEQLSTLATRSLPKPWLPWFLSWPLSTFDSHGLTPGHQTYGLLLLSPVLVRITFHSPFPSPVAVVAFLPNRLICFLWRHMILLKSLVLQEKTKDAPFFLMVALKENASLSEDTTIQSSLRRETQQVSASTDGISVHPGTLEIDACLSHNLGGSLEGQMGVVNSPSWLSFLRVHTHLSQT